MAVRKKKTPLYAVVGAGDLVVEKVRSRRPSLAPAALRSVPEQAKTTRTRAKAATTSARRTASQAKRAAGDAADKVGD